MQLEALALGPPPEPAVPAVPGQPAVGLGSTPQRTPATAASLSIPVPVPSATADKEPSGAADWSAEAFAASLGSLDTHTSLGLASSLGDGPTYMRESNDYPHSRPSDGSATDYDFEASMGSHGQQPDSTHTAHAANPANGSGGSGGAGGPAARRRLNPYGRQVRSASIDEYDYKEPVPRSAFLAQRQLNRSKFSKLKRSAGSHAFFQLLGELYCYDSERSQLNMIFSLLGTPDDVSDTEHLEPGSCAKVFVHEVAHVQPRDMQKMIPAASPASLEFLKAMLHFNPLKRLSAAQAMGSSVFDPIRKVGYISEKPEYCAQQQFHSSEGAVGEVPVFDVDVEAQKEEPHRIKKSVSVKVFYEIIVFSLKSCITFNSCILLISTCL